jgi:hypothetical protein
MRRTRTTVGVVAAAMALTVGVTGCGGSQAGHHRGAGPFAWLRPAPPPTTWKVARIPRGSTLAYPPGWKPIKTDQGTATVALLGGGERIDGYLNATPKQGSETLANWSRFRVDHNRREGSRHVRLVASANDLRFRSGRGSCVIDSTRPPKPPTARSPASSPARTRAQWWSLRPRPSCGRTRPPHCNGPFRASCLERGAALGLGRRTPQVNREGRP